MDEASAAIPVTTPDSGAAPSASPPGRTAIAAPLGRHAAGGAFWSFVQTFTAKVAGVVTQFFVLYKLDEASFGAVAQALALSAVTSWLIRFGMAEVLVQRQKRFGAIQNAGATISLISGIVLVLSTFVIALGYGLHQASHSQSGGHPWLVPELLLVWTMGYVIDSVLTVPQAKMRVNLRFREQSMIWLKSSVIAAVATILFLMLKMGPVSIVLARPVQRLYELVAVYRAEPVSLRFTFKWSSWKPLLRDGIPVVFTTLSWTMIVNADNLAVGAFCGEKILGLYAVGYNLCTQTLQLVVTNMVPSLFSVLAKLGEEPRRQAEAGLRACEMMLLVCTPCCFLQAAVAGPLLHLFFRDKWDGAIPVLQILSIGMPFAAIWMCVSALLQAQGRFRLQLLWQMSMGVLFVIVVMIAAKAGGILWVAVGVSGFYFLTGPIGSYIATRPGHVGVWRNLRIYIWPVFASFVACSLALLVIAGMKAAARQFAIPHPLFDVSDRIAAFGDLCFVSISSLLLYVALTIMLRKETTRIALAYAAPLLARLNKGPFRNIVKRIQNLGSPEIT